MRVSNIRDAFLRPPLPRKAPLAPCDGEPLLGCCLLQVPKRALVSTPNYLSQPLRCCFLAVETLNPWAIQALENFIHDLSESRFIEVEIYTPYIHLHPIAAADSFQLNGTYSGSTPSMCTISMISECFLEIHLATSLGKHHQWICCTSLAPLVQSPRIFACTGSDFSRVPCTLCVSAGPYTDTLRISKI